MKNLEGAVKNLEGTVRNLECDVKNLEGVIESQHKEETENSQHIWTTLKITQFALIATRV